MITAPALVAQEERFARAFAAGDLSLARALYHPAVVYLSPTVRLFGWPARIEGVERTLEFIGLTIRHLEAIAYHAVEWAIGPGGQAAFVRIHFDFTRAGRRLRGEVVFHARDSKPLAAASATPDGRFGERHCVTPGTVCRGRPLLRAPGPSTYSGGTDGAVTVSSQAPG